MRKCKLTRGEANLLMTLPDLPVVGVIPAFLTGPPRVDGLLWRGFSTYGLEPRLRLRLGILDGIGRIV